MLNWLKSRVTENNPTHKTHIENTQNDYSKLLAGLQTLRNIAWQHAIEYRFDPILSEAHEEYLNTANTILKGLENE